MPQILSEPSSTATLRPICVDLDGTLVKSDTLADSLLAMTRTHPARLLGVPASLLGGKAALKAYVTDSISLDVVHLPYNHAVLRYLQDEHLNGRPIYLTTGADTRLAERVAAHLGIFSGVLGSDGATNLTGKNKLESLLNRFGPGGFDYIGNATPDLPLLAHATEPMVANPSLALRLRLSASGIVPKRRLDERRSSFRVLVKALRIHQWSKNLLIAIPCLLAHGISVQRILAVALAFASFSLTASATYMVNDLLDIEADRRHPRKRLRPFAAGDLSPASGLVMILLLLGLAFLGAHFLPRAFSGWLLLYLGSTLAYSLYLKRIALVDVLVLSGLYTLRLQAGSAATATPISHWLAGFAIFLFLSLAIVKRFAELENLRVSGLPPKNGRGYLVADTEQLRSFGTSSAFAAVVIFAIYISGHDVMTLYRNARLLWLIVPLMILWLSRVWLLASRGELNEDPVVFALTDRMSQFIGLAVVALALLAL